MGIEVFNRYESKFLLDQSTYEILEERLVDNMELDEFNKAHEFYTISNIYYDTKGDELITKSLAKPVYKEKLRLRAYGVPELEDKVYLEIKKKVKGLVNKRRTHLKLMEAYEFVSTGIKPEIKANMNKQVLNEIEYFLKIYELEPKIYLAYDRKAYFSKENRDLRITFDTNIRTRRTDLKMESGTYGEQLLSTGQWLMEIKAEKTMPLWLSKLLSENKIYPTSFSKYGKEFENRIIKTQNMKGAFNSCLNPYLVAQQQVPQFLS